LAVKVAISGCGRLGRMAIMAMLEDPNINIVAINDSHEVSLLARLLELDLHREVKIDGNDIVIKDIKIPVIEVSDYKDLPWGEMGVDVVVENHINMTREEINMHILAGAKKVILPVPERVMPTMPLVNMVEVNTIYEPRDDIYGLHDQKSYVRMLNQKYHDSRILPSKKKYHSKRGNNYKNNY
jgi:glyceraldehyde-3-phosphate dehydrogenase/erythrose-4-phosphate dehydrogenase